MYDIIINMVIGLATGIISGAISGILVTRYYRKKDQEIFKKEQHEKAITLATDFFEDLQIEISRAEEKRNGDYSRILNILERKQRYLQELIKGDYAMDMEAYDDIMKSLMEIEVKLKKNTFDFEQDNDKIQNIFLSAFKILY